MYLAAKDLVAVYPKDKVYKDLIMTGIEQLKTTAKHVEHIRHEMDALASYLPEYKTVLSMHGIGKTLSQQLIAEISHSGKVKPIGWIVYGLLIMVSTTGATS